MNETLMGEPVRYRWLGLGYLGLESVYCEAMAKMSRFGDLMFIRQASSSIWLQGVAFRRRHFVA
jgi:hypothetical protein